MSKIELSEDTVKRIMERTVTPPMGYTTRELCAWMNGYAKCQMDIIEVITGGKEDNEGLETMRV